MQHNIHLIMGYVRTEHTMQREGNNKIFKNALKYHIQNKTMMFQHIPEIAAVTFSPLTVIAHLHLSRKLPPLSHQQL